MNLPTNPSESFKRSNPHIYPAGATVPDTKQCECQKTLAGDSPREAQGARCPTVCFTLCRVQLLDVDAKYSSVKDLLDGLQHAGCIYGDKEGEVVLIVNQKKVSHYDEEQTIIEIYL
jgi:hypothetical protein